MVKNALTNTKMAYAANQRHCIGDKRYALQKEDLAG